MIISQLDVKENLGIFAGCLSGFLKGNSFDFGQSGNGVFHQGGAVPPAPEGLRSQIGGIRFHPSLTAKQKQNLLYPLGLKEILLVAQSIKM